MVTAVAGASTAGVVGGIAVGAAVGGGVAALIIDGGKHNE